MPGTRPIPTALSLSPVPQTAGAGKRAVRGWKLCVYQRPIRAPDPDPDIEPLEFFPDGLGLGVARLTYTSWLLSFLAF
jgi:hypothetical protein